MPPHLPQQSPMTLLVYCLTQQAAQDLNKAACSSFAMSACRLSAVTCRSLIWALTCPQVPSGCQSAPPGRCQGNAAQAIAMLVAESHAVLRSLPPGRCLPSSAADYAKLLQALAHISLVLLQRGQRPGCGSFEKCCYTWHRQDPDCKVLRLEELMHDVVGLIS